MNIQKPIITDQHITLSVQGLHCANCIMKVEQNLKAAGANSIDVNLERGTASFNLAEASTIEDILFKLKKAGYPASTITSANDTKADWFKTYVLICCLLTAPLLLHMFVDWHWLHNPFVQLALSTPVVLFNWRYFGTSAWNALKSGVPNMDVLVVTGVTAAFVYSLIGLILNLGPNYMFFETAASITCFVLIGNLLERRALKATTSALTELVKLQVVPARRIKQTDSGAEIEIIDAEQVGIADLLALNNGDRVPVDGVLKQGSVYVDQSMLSGESQPILKSVGDQLYGGTLVVEGSGNLEVTSIGADSILGRIISMVRDAQSSRPPIQRMGDVVSAWFVPAVFLIALATFALNFLAADLGLQESLLRTIAVLVIACPCAMGLATPTAISVALGRAAKSGIFFKSAATIEALASARQVAFDKTGTLTSNIKLVEENVVNPKLLDRFRSLLYSIESRSSHPLAQAIVEHYEKLSPARLNLENFNEQRGLGVSATIDGKHVALGSKKIFPTGFVADPNSMSEDLFLFEDNQLLGSLQLAESLKSDTAEALNLLKELGYELLIISGDSNLKVQTIAKQLGIDKFFAEQSPEDKLTKIAQLQSHSGLIYVGDGINDAPALSKATVGIALSDATQVAIDSAAVVINQKDLGRVSQSIQLARITLKVIKQNLFWAFFYNIAAIPLAAMGYLTPMLAAIVMALSDVIVIGNSLRLKTIKLSDAK